MNSRAKKIIVVLGPPGSGKGAQGELLSEKAGLYYFETSKILEKSFKDAKQEEFVKIGGKKFFFKKEKELWEKGILCSPPFVSYLFKRQVKELYKQGENLLLSGSPRTLFEGKTIMPFLGKLYGKENIKVILIEVSPRESLFRNSHRRICELMRHPILYTKDTKNLKLCPIDGSKLVKRKGLDNPETIKVRLEEYKERTLPLVGYLKGQGFRVSKVKGEGSVDSVFARILKALK